MPLSPEALQTEARDYPPGPEQLWDSLDIDTMDQVYADFAADLGAEIGSYVDNRHMTNDTMGYGLRRKWREFRDRAALAQWAAQRGHAGAYAGMMPAKNAMLERERKSAAEMARAQAWLAIDQALGALEPEQAKAIRQAAFDRMFPRPVRQTATATPVPTLGGVPAPLPIPQAPTSSAA